MKRYRSDAFNAALISSTEEVARRKEAAAIVDRWNAQLAAAQFSPTIGAAIRAGKSWLRLFCPGCRQMYQIDLRPIVRPHDFPVTALRAALVCESMCRSEGPKPKLLGLSTLPDEGFARRESV